MKTKACLFVLWASITLILVFSIIGMVLFIPRTGYDDKFLRCSTWMNIGQKLLDSIIVGV